METAKRTKENLVQGMNGSMHIERECMTINAGERRCQGPLVTFTFPPKDKTPHLDGPWWFEN